jgi:tetratricopeptide (TPR) repeat protein
MFFAPISTLVTTRIPRSYTPVSPHSGRMILAAALLAFLAACSYTISAQDSAPQFDDVAARAASARDQGHIPEAVDLYTKAEQLKPDWAEGWFYLGLLQYQANQYPQAIEAFNRLLQLQPTAAPAMALRGLCEYETAAYEDALRDLEQATAHGAADQPRNAQIIRFHLGQLLAHAGRFQDALDQYKFFATKHVDAPDLLLGIGLAGLRVITLPKDVASEDRVIFEAAGEAGYALLAEESERGDDLFRQLFSRYPTAPNLHLFYGLLLFPHDPTMALEEFRSELAVDASNETAHAMLAYTLMIAGRYTEALPEAERAYSAAPDTETAQLALGRSLAETGDVKRGTDLLNQVLQKDPNNLEAHLGLMSIYSRSGRREDANRERAVCLKLPK